MLQLDRLCLLSVRADHIAPAAGGIVPLAGPFSDQVQKKSKEIQHLGSSLFLGAPLVVVLDGETKTKPVCKPQEKPLRCFWGSPIPNKVTDPLVWRGSNSQVARWISPAVLRAGGGHGLWHDDHQHRASLKRMGGERVKQGSNGRKRQLVVALDLFCSMVVVSL